MKSSVYNDIMKSHQRLFNCEYGIDAKSFFNFYKQLYDSGDLAQSLSLIRPKHFVGVGFVKLDMPLKRDPKHFITLNVQTQNDLKKNLGLTLLKFNSVFNVNKELLMKNTLQLKSTTDWSYTLMFQKSLYDSLLALKLSNEFNSKHLINPNISFVSTQLPPFTLQGGVHLADQSFNFSIGKSE